MGTEKKLKITVLGLWHLGSVTAACSAEHFEVTGLDFNEALVSNLNQGLAPIQEPDLNELIQKGLGRKALKFTTNAKEGCSKADILWVCYDTPVDRYDKPDTQFVLNQIQRCFPHLPPDSIVLLSSQMPVGTSRKLEQKFSARRISVAYSPENLRLGQALDAFRRAERIVVGVRKKKAKKKLQLLFNRFCDHLLFVSPESAEMTKHALNGFLALSIAYMNEIADLCESVKADAKEVEEGLKTDARIGRRAYLSAGQAFAGGTLARDVVSLCQAASDFGKKFFLIPSIKKSNDAHKKWAFDKLKRLKGKRKVTVGVLGLTYKPFTDTLRRSSAVELCEQLLNSKFKVAAFDPAIHPKQLPRKLNGVVLCEKAEQVFSEADAVVLSTPWPCFRELPWPGLVKTMRGSVVLDPNSYVRDMLRNLPGVKYFAVGLPS